MLYKKVEKAFQFFCKNMKNEKSEKKLKIFYNN